MARGLTAAPLGGVAQFNWYFLVEILVVGILALFFLFYFNRLLATIVSYAIRAWTWHRYRAYIDITSLQISPLGGRIFFKSIRYHAHNITVLIYDGHITWRYWLRLAKVAAVFEEIVSDAKRVHHAPETGHEDDDAASEGGSKDRRRSIGNEEAAGKASKKQLPCRVHVVVSGVEAFIYNRSPVYDAILEQARKQAKQKTASTDGKVDGEPAKVFTSDSSDNAEQWAGRWAQLREVASAASVRPHDGKDITVPQWLRIFPISVECKRAAAVLGNESTTSVITAKIDRATGSIDAGKAGPLDIYKLLFTFDIEKINVALKRNRDFKQGQIALAKRKLREHYRNPSPTRAMQIPRFVAKVVRHLSVKKTLKRKKSSIGSLRFTSFAVGQYDEKDCDDSLPGEAQWHGLARYLDESLVDEHEEWEDVEYAKASSLAEIESLTMRFYFDMPGQVPLTAAMEDSTAHRTHTDEINGAEPPDYGMEFNVRGGVVTYGPWADRQRINLQQIFIPASYVDAETLPPLSAGDTRVWSLFKIFITVEKDLILRIPSRESSKDAKWRGRAENMKKNEMLNTDKSKTKGKRQKGGSVIVGTDIRPYGWLDITIKTDTTVSYVMDMFPGSKGYQNKLDVDAKGTVITSSVNHGLLWTTDRVTVEADLSQPLTWNTLRSWPFDITIDNLQLFILRDHLFLIIDLVNDWSSGAPSEFSTFVPYRYEMHMLFRNFCMYLNVNDSNIVNDPADFDKNDFVTLEGKLDANLSIDMEKFRPVRNMISYDVLATDMSMRMLSPSRSTLNTFLGDKTVATLPKLTLSGSYSGHIEQRVGLTDTLRFDIVGSGLSLIAYGFLVRQLVNIKENYFGDYLHFKTLEEFQDADDDMQVANLKTASLPKPTSINELDVILCIIAEDATVMLPTNLYSAEELIRFELPVANLDLRILSYYLDMGLQISPISVFTGKSVVGDGESSTEGGSGTQLYVKHLDLDGHRSFGPPPNEPAYISQWSIDIGAITGELTGTFTHDLALAGRAFAFTFPDLENSLLLESPTNVNDVTFVQVRTNSTRIGVHVGNDALIFSADPISVSTNDLADDIFSQRISVLAPKVTLAVIDGRHAARHRSKNKVQTPVKTYAFLQTGASISVTKRAADFVQERRKQQAHIRMCDQRTRRADFLLRPYGQALSEVAEDIPFEPPCMPFPRLATPLNQAGHNDQRSPSLRSRRSAHSRTSIRPKSSSSSLSDSVRMAGMSTMDAGKFGIGELSPQLATASNLHRDHSAASLGFRQPGLENGLLEPQSVAFSSSFSEPYFPLDSVCPDESNIPNFERFDVNPLANLDNSNVEISGDLESDTKSSRTAVLIRLVPGVRSYIEPHIGVTIAGLLQLISPRTPMETFDTFQMDVIGSLECLQKPKDFTGDVTELDIAVPSTFIRVAQTESRDMPSAHIDITFRSVEALVRMRTEFTDEKATNSLAVHATASRLIANLEQVKDGVNITPAISADIGDVLVWVASVATDSIHVNIGETNFAISGEQASFMVDLGLALVPLVEQISRNIQTPLHAKRKRLLLLMHTFLSDSSPIGDPPFLSGLTNLLRASSHHVRTQDSWRALMRYRYLLHRLPHEVLQSLSSRLSESDIGEVPFVPPNELQSWTQWRNWDIPNVSQTLMFQMLFHHLEGKIMPDMIEKPLALTVRSNFLRAAIQAHSGFNEVVIEDMSLGLEQTPPSQPKGLLLIDDNVRRSNLTQLHASSVIISLDWSIFAITDAIIPCLKNLQPILSMNQSAVTETKPPDDHSTRQEFHVIVSTDVASLSIQSINLRHQAELDQLKFSAIGTSQAGGRYGGAVSAMLNADKGIAKLHGPDATPIWDALLTSPSIYIDHVESLPWTDELPSFMVAVSYNELQLAVQEQIAGLLRIVDSVILDEVTKIAGLVDRVKAELPNLGQDTLSTNESTVAVSSGPRVNVALLTGKLRIELALLSTLSYKLEGISASIRLAPSLTKTDILSVDFDIGSQLHAFVNKSRNQWKQQDILNMPHINGHVAVHRVAQAVNLVSVATTVERVEVDASAIQGVASILGRPEVKHIVSAIESTLDDIKQHAGDLEPEPAPVSTNLHGPPTKTPAFDLRFALLGIRVAAKAPIAMRKATAEVEFGTGPFYVVLSNKTNKSNKLMLVPEVRSQIRGIGAKLQVQEGTENKQCGVVNMGIDIHFRSSLEGDAKISKELDLLSNDILVMVHPETASVVVDIVNHLQDRFKNLDLSMEVDYLRRLRDARRQTLRSKVKTIDFDQAADVKASMAEDLLSVQTFIQLRNIQFAWIVGQRFAASMNSRVEDLVLSIEQIEFTTRRGQEARLIIDDMQLALIKHSFDVQKRSPNSAILPKMGFSVRTWTREHKRSLAFKAKGEALEIRLQTSCISRANNVYESIMSAVDDFRTSTATWESLSSATGVPSTQSFDMTFVDSLLAEADFAGAQVYMQGAGPRNRPALNRSQSYQSQHGRYGQFAAEGARMQTALKAPGIALRLEYYADERQPSVKAELRIDASSNRLLPNVVPLVLEVLDETKEVIRGRRDPPSIPATTEALTSAVPQAIEEESFIMADPTAIFGKTKIDLALRICRQDFGLTCQPIARVDAKAALGELYLSMNTIHTDDHGHFFGVSAIITGVSAEVKHMYSREPTFSFDMNSVALSVLNNKHLSGTSGVSAILKIHPTRMYINGKQLQDLLLFREIWMPPEIRASQETLASPSLPSKPVADRPEEYFAKRYQAVASSAAFPWNVTISIAELAVDVDLGQSIGKSSFSIADLWAAQAKSSNSEQSLCIGMQEMAVTSTGRMSGFIRLENLSIRTAIKWPDAEEKRRTPLIQASLGFERLRAKAAFDYQAFAFGDIEGFDFLMYNIREEHSSKDRLVALLDCQKAYVFCTSTSPAQAVAVYQAFDRLVLEKQAAFSQSLKDIEKHLRRESTIVPTRFGPSIPQSPIAKRETKQTVSLHTDVVLTIGAISFGIFPSTFFDSQILKSEANNIQARFAVGAAKEKIVSSLSMTLGQLQVALASARRATAVPKALDVSVDEVITSAVNSKGGVILKVPKVIAAMQTWQAAESNNVDYIFKSLFEGKIDVGWNLSRINFIKGMWTAHSRALVSQLGKSLPESAVKITAGPVDPKSSDRPGFSGSSAQRQEKIMAEVNLPQSKYEYRALEPPIIETPQLRDMGEATPPLEWIGLHRDRLPNVTHQIVIVSLLEVAREVGDAYEKILGSS